MKTRAYAKVNLLLKVLGKRKSDGYHNLQMLMQTISLYDEIELKLTAEETISIKMINSKEDIPNKNNIVYKIAEHMRNSFNLPGGMKITITKNIPSGAGLGGGSSDGAQILKMINQRYHLKLTNKQLINIGKKFGADIPFFIEGGFAEVSGIGEKIKILPDLNPYYLLIVKPFFGIPTAKAYAAVTKYSKKKKLPSNLQNIEQLTEIMTNELTEPAISTRKSLATFIKKLTPQQGIAIMSGSGSAIAIYFKKKSDRDAYYNEIQSKTKETIIKATSINPQKIDKINTTTNKVALATLLSVGALIIKHITRKNK